MNKLKLTGIGILILAIILPILIASEGDLEASLTYDEVLEETNAYSLIFEEDTIKIGNILTTELVFSNEEEMQGFYYKKDGELLSVPGNYLFITPKINGINYRLEHFESLSDYLTEDEEASLEIETEQGFFALTTQREASIDVNEQSIQGILIPDSNGKALINVEDTFLVYDAPLTLLFKQGQGADGDTDLVGNAGGEAEVNNQKEGCFDSDDEAENPQDVSGFVNFVFREDGRLKTITTPDFCAMQQGANGQAISRLYEASCEKGTPTYSEVSCNCENGACVSEQESERFCYDSDPLILEVQELERMTDPEIRQVVEAFTYTFGSKGNTVGHYANANNDGGKDFGLWEDYCSTDKVLVEYYCSNDQNGMYRTVICPNGCSGGKCAEKPFCYESDGGKTNIYRGITKTVTANDEYLEMTDECVDANSVREYYCDSSNTETAMSEEIMACGEGNYCNEGKCIPVEPCESNEDCEDGYVCNPETEQCEETVELECEADADCDDGFFCNENNECEEEQITLEKCSSCMNVKPFHIMEWRAESCERGAKQDIQISRCPTNHQCVKNDRVGITCAAEPLSTWSNIKDAFERRLVWAEWLNPFIGGDEEGVDDSAEDREWGAGLASVAEGLNQVEAELEGGIELAEDVYSQQVHNINVNQAEQETAEAAEMGAVVVPDEEEEEEEEESPTELDAERGSPCSTNADCDDVEKCLNTYCVPIICNGPLDCGGFICDDGICDTCTSDNDCASGNCNYPELVDNDDDYVEGMCMPAKE